MIPAAYSAAGGYGYMTGKRDGVHEVAVPAISAAMDAAKQKMEGMTLGQRIFGGLGFAFSPKSVTGSMDSALGEMAKQPAKSFWSDPTGEKQRLLKAVQQYRAQVAAQSQAPQA